MGFHTRWKRQLEAAGVSQVAGWLVCYPAFLRKPLDHASRPRGLSPLLADSKWVGWTWRGPGNNTPLKATNGAKLALLKGARTLRTGPYYQWFTTTPPFHGVAGTDSHGMKST